MQPQFAQLQKNSMRRLLNALVEHPFIFLSPILLIMSLVGGLAIRKDTFRSSAVLFFESANLLDASGPDQTRDLNERKFALVNSLLVGRPIREILEKVWPGVDAKRDPVRYNRLLTGLRGKSGLQLEFKRENPQALEISYETGDPDLAFNVVRAATDVLLALNKEKKVGGVNARVEFLNKELELYSEKLRTDQQKILDIKATLPAEILRRYLQERTVQSMLASRNGADDHAQFLKTLDDLRINLAVSQRNYERLVQNLKELQRGDRVDSELPSVPNYDDDPLIREFTRLIAEKEQEVSKIVAQGYLPAHPERKNAELELENLKASKVKRAQELETTASQNPTDSPVRRAAMRKLQDQLEEKKIEIETLKDKIAMMESYDNELQAKRRQQSEGARDNSDAYADQIASLRNLEKESEIITDNYNRVQKQLQVALQTRRQEEEDGGLNVYVTEEPLRAQTAIPKAYAPILILGLVLAVSLGLGLIFAISVLDSSVNSVIELQRFSKVPVLGQIDRIMTGDEAQTKRRALLRKFFQLVTVSIASFFVSWFLFGAR